MFELLASISSPFNVSTRVLHFGEVIAAGTIPEKRKLLASCRIPAAQVVAASSSSDLRVEAKRISATGDFEISFSLSEDTSAGEKEWTVRLNALDAEGNSQAATSILVDADVRDRVYCPTRTTFLGRLNLDEANTCELPIVAATKGRYRIQGVALTNTGPHGARSTTENEDFTDTTSILISVIPKSRGSHTLKVIASVLHADQSVTKVPAFVSFYVP